MPSDLTIVTLSRNAEYVERLATALGQSLGAPPYSHVLVNNARGVEGGNITAMGLKHGMLVVEPGYNTTFSAGNNMATRVVDAPWLLLLNDDAMPTPEFLAKLWVHRKHAGVLGALLLHVSGTVNHAGTCVYMSTGGAIVTDHLGRNGARSAWDQGAPLVPAVTFAAALLQRATFDELGGLDERYAYGWEDTDYCLRVLRAGGDIRGVRDAVAFHDECGTRPRGGAADAENNRVFQRTWRQSAPGILRDYNGRHEGKVLGL